LELSLAATATVAAIQIIVLRAAALIFLAAIGGLHAAAAAAAGLFMSVVLFQSEDNGSAELPRRVDEEPFQPLLNGETHQVLAGYGAHNLHSDSLYAKSKKVRKKVRKILREPFGIVVL
jgi:hypothetical protein